VVAARLRALDFAVHVVEGGGYDFWSSLAQTYTFPDYFGGSGWDAASECFGDVVFHARSVLLWRDADQVAAADPAFFGEACAMLTGIFDSLGRVEGKQAELVLIGSGDAFPSPRQPL